MVKVIVSKPECPICGISTYHIWDNDNREIALHKPDVVELIRKFQEALRKDK